MFCVYTVAKEFCSWNEPDANPALVAAISSLLLAALGSAEITEREDAENFVPNGHTVQFEIPELGTATFKLGHINARRAVYAHCGEFSDPVIFTTS